MFTWIHVQMITEIELLSRYNVAIATPFFIQKIIHPVVANIHHSILDSHEIDV